MRLIAVNFQEIKRPIGTAFLLITLVPLIGHGSKPQPVARDAGTRCVLSGQMIRASLPVHELVWRTLWCLSSCFDSTLLRRSRRGR